MSGHTPTGFLERQPVEVTTSAGDAVLVRGYDSRLYPDNERVTIMNCVTNAGAQLPTEICEANAAYAAACWNAFLGSELRADEIERGMVARLLKINADLLEALEGVMPLVERLVAYHDGHDDKPCHDPDAECPISMAEFLWPEDRKAISKAQAAISRASRDATAQPMTLCDSGGGSHLFSKIAEHHAADMRERAAKLVEEEGEPAQVFGTDGEAAIYRDLASAIRALPLEGPASSQDGGESDDGD